MKITITHEFDNADDAIAFLQGPAPTTAEVPAPAKTRGRPKKATTPTPDGTDSKDVEPVRAPEAPAVVAPEPVTPATQAVAGTSEVETPAPAVAGTVDKDTALGALRTYFNTKGPEAAGKLLSSFNVTRFSELTKDQYAAFMAAASK